MRKYLLLPAVVLALTANPALAQDAYQSETATNDESIQSVELSAAELVETKNTMSIITEEVMERKNADNLTEALRMEPGIQMTGNGVGFRGSSYVNIRGFDSGRIGMFFGRHSFGKRLGSRVRLRQNIHLGFGFNRNF